MSISVRWPSFDTFSSVPWWGTSAVFAWRGLSVEWIFGALIADYVVKTAMLSWRFRSGRWVTTLAAEPRPRGRESR